MLRVVAHKSAAAAKQYYSEGLRREDYYSEGQEITGKWHGRAAERLGLIGNVTPKGFAALVENHVPSTGERLTSRTKSERIVGYDLNFHAPKSLSVLYALTGDEEILKAFRSSVSETMGEIEAQVSTRVRKKGADENRITGNFAWAEFVHLTARPVGGIPDPHLHVHCFAFNATYDDKEGHWKAANFRDIKKDAPYSEAAFHSRLTAKLAALGYGIERTRQGWELKGIPRSIIDKFSRRTSQIERLAQAKGITDPKLKDILGAASREGKRHGLTYSDLLAAWGSRLTEAEKVTISKVRFDRGQAGAEAVEKVTPTNAFDEASEKLFAKHSVVELKRLVAETLRFGVGQVTPDEAWKEIGRRKMVVKEVDGELLCTSVSVLTEEVALINFVRSGRGMSAPLKRSDLSLVNRMLSAEQALAVLHILNSSDQVIGVRGGAGVGKTTLMREAVDQIEASGKRVFAFAPSATASRETLREAGFAGAETVAHLLTNKKLQTETRGQVIWIDEAGLLGVRDMAAIMEIAGESTRVILTGDTAQHAPVARGDAFRLIQHYAGLRVAEVTQIRRQEKEDYRKAVSALSKGDLRTAFRRLEKLGAIIEVVDDAERYRVLASDFLRLSRKESIPLVVSPTHAEGARVTEAIRDAKRGIGTLGSERRFIQYHDLKWEEPDRRRPENYKEGLIVQFNQNAQGIQRGELFRVTGLDGKGGVAAVSPAGRAIALPFKDASRFQVFEEREIILASGDRIRITRNGKSEDGRRLNNGNVFTIVKFTRDGKMTLNNGAILAPDHGHLTYGYCQTSHSSQSKTVRDVLIAQSASSFVASSKEQLYVSVSRAKESVRIYVDNRLELQQAVGATSTRRAGVELAGFNSKEVGTLMSGDTGSRQWRDLVKSRSDEGPATAHVKNLLKERKNDGFKKTPNMDFREYIAMRRGIASGGGKSRSKSHPPVEGKKIDLQNRGRSFLRPTQPSATGKVTPTNGSKKPVQPPKTARPPQNRLQRIAEGYQVAKNHFKKATETVKNKVNRLKPGQVSQLPKSNPSQISQHVTKQRAVDAGKAAKIQLQAKQAQVRRAPAPVPKPGK